MLKDSDKRLPAAAGILLAALLAFGLTLRVGFLWDDHRMIESNPHISMSAANLVRAFRGDPFDQGLNYYRPLQTVSNMADFSLWGLRPFGYHLTNFAFHAAAALLFFLLALELGFGRDASFWAAVLLAAHPAAVEQMLVIAGRAELASGACVAASLLLFLRGRAAWSFLLFLAACGFKENGVITPTLAALCLWYLRRPRSEYRKLLPFLAFVPVYLLLRHGALGMGLFSRGAGPVAAGLFLKVPQAVLVYLKEAALPFDMHSHRMQPQLAVLNWTALPALAAAAALIWRKGGRGAAFCAGWYLLNLAPKFPLLAANDLMLDHWAYLSNAGLFLWVSDKLAGKTAGRRALAAAAAVFVLASALNIPKRDTDLKIYEHAALSSASKPMLYNLAREYYLRGRFRKSRLLLERIAAEAPDEPSYLDGLALARWKDGDAPGALKALDAALALKPGDTETLFNRYTVLRGSGMDKEAAAALMDLLRLHPDYAPALLVLARSEAAVGRAAEAEGLYRRVLAADPADTEALNDYGILLARRGDIDGAERLFRKALGIAPGMRSAADNLARAEEIKKGRSR
ncbi:MAG: tetratricopeptide repeat protein [Elusimicrobia bacterium]|nr:tetratricopeptide repeat protein [Elusimicrobiota bacterium]